MCPLIRSRCAMCRGPATPGGPHPPSSWGTKRASRVAAVLAVMLGTQADFEGGVRAANAAAAVVVGKRGTATVSAAELRSRLLPAASLAAEEKIVFDWSVLDDRLAEWRRQGIRIGFSNGCFDLLHPG